MSQTDQDEPKTLVKQFQGLFRNVIWPAVAGNVAWAFFTVWLTGQPYFFHERLWALGLIAVYLMFSWLRDDQNGDEPIAYMAMDGMIAVFIALFAIALQECKGDDAAVFGVKVNHYLAAMLGLNAMGHLTGTWNKLRAYWKGNLLAGVNGAAAIWVLCRPQGSPDPEMWRLPAAIGLVLAAWLLIICLEPAKK